jgi:hypothetical protein
MKRARLFLLLIVAALTLIPLPGYARIRKTRPPASSNVYPGVAPPSPWAVFAPLVLSLGFEYQSDQEETQYEFPISLEYNLTQKLKLILEPTYVSIASKSVDTPSVNGFGDLEAAVDYEFLSERRYRPALAVEGRIKWQTAEDPDLGEPGNDYTFGIIASKDLVYLDVDLNLFYTFIGDREKEDEVEISLAAEWHVNRYVDLIAEVSNVMRTQRPRDATIESRNEIEATLGLGWQINKNLRFEHGVVLKERGEWELVVSCEWNFGGD